MNLLHARFPKFTLVDDPILKAGHHQKRYFFRSTEFNFVGCCFPFRKDIWRHFLRIHFDLVHLKVENMFDI